MTTDLSLVAGICLVALSLPSFLNAFTHGRSPRLAALFAVIGLGLIVYANSARTGGYGVQDIPAAFGRVIAQFTR